MVNGKKVLKGMFDPDYIRCVLPHVGCKSKDVATCLENYLINGGSMASYATTRVNRDSIFRAVKRFEKLHNDVLKASEILCTESKKPC